MRALTLGLSPALEAEYRVAYTRESMPFVRVMILLGLFIYLLFGAWDYLLFPEQKATLWLIRAGVVAPFLLLTLYATYRPSLQPHWQTFLILSTLVAIGALVAMMFHLPEGAAMTHIHPGIQMCLMFCFTAFKLRFVHAFGAGAAGIGLFYWAAIGPLQFPPAALVNTAFFLVGSLFTGALTAWLLERYSRFDFLQRRENDRLIRALEAEKRVAIEANASKSRFLAAASHDLRQPLHAIGLLTDLLRERTRDADLQGLGDGIHRAVIAMETQFGGLLDISRLDAGNVETDVQPVALDALAGTLRAVHAPAAAAKGLTLDLDGAGLAVLSDPGHLERILGNLVDNAIKYTDRGVVALTARAEGEAVRVDVIDTGRGIPSTLRAKIFEEFFQIDNAARDRARGLGIGLAIVRRLVALLGHRLDVESAPGGGSRFSLQLPAAPATQRLRDRGIVGTTVAVETDVEGGDDGGPSADADALAGAFIVVIDDDADVRRALCAVLEGWGCHVAQAGNAADALQALEGHLRGPDLVLTDYRLGDAGSGIDAIGRIRAAYEPTLPAVLLTGDPLALLPPGLAGVSIAQKPIHGARLRRMLAAQRKAGRVAC